MITNHLTNLYHQIGDSFESLESVRAKGIVEIDLWTQKIALNDISGTIDMLRAATGVNGITSVGLPH